MSTDPSSLTAFFYRQPVLLDREQHKGLRLKAGDLAFAARSQSVPLVAAEFADASLEYPIVFAKADDGQWLALALTGLQPQVNAFVDAQGRWSGRYVPASVRRYPFILADSGKDQFSVAIDLAAPHWGQEGEALFDADGQPAELIRRLLPLLGDFQQQALRTSALAQALEAAQLLTQQNLQVRLGDGREAVVEGVWIVDEAKLRELSDEKVLAWFKGGELGAIHAHMLSLRNLVPLLERSQPAPGAAPAASPPARKAARKPANKPAP